jgi:DNA (cytosine-5)-methyltransferase 1
VDLSDKRWNMLAEFARLIEESKPDIVTMENVPPLEKQEVFRRFLGTLKRLKYKTTFQVVNCADYGVPQFRRRLVLLASKFGAISLIAPTHPSDSYLTVKNAIGDLPPLQAGEIDSRDPLHQASSLSETNLKRIKASRQGGTWRDWNKNLVAACHTKDKGHTYSGVYGRMSWDEPSPTMTTQFFGFGNGRFGHPEQDRGLSLREGAILQSFPRRYRFVPKDKPIHRKILGRLIGNAVPVRLGAAIGITIFKHVGAHWNIDR